MKNKCNTCATCQLHYQDENLIWTCAVKNIAMAKNDGCILGWTEKITDDSNIVPDSLPVLSPIESTFAGNNADCELDMIAKIRDSFPILERYIDSNSMVSYSSAVLYGIFKYLEEKEISQTHSNNIIKISSLSDVLLYRKHSNTDVLIMDIKDNILLGIYYEGNIATVAEWDKYTGNVIASFSPNTKNLIPIEKEWYNYQNNFPCFCEEDDMWFIAVSSDDVDIIYDSNGDGHRAGLVSRIDRSEIINRKLSKSE